MVLITAGLEKKKEVWFFILSGDSNSPLRYWILAQEKQTPFFSTDVDI